MQYLVLIIADDFHDRLEEQLGKIGFRRKLATEDKKLAFQLPFSAFAGMRDGDSVTQVRDDVLTELGKEDVSAFVVVAEGFSSGRT